MATVAELVKTAQASALALKYQKQSEAALASVTPAPSAGDQAAINEISTAGFSNELEKHLSDYRKGRAELSKKTSGKLSFYDNQTNSLLQNISPQALRDYGAYGTFMSYEHRARYVSNVYSSAREIAAMQRSYEKA